MPIIRSLYTAVAASGFPLERGGSSVVGRGRPTTTNDTATTTFQLFTKQYLLTIGKPEAATTFYKLLMMGKKMPET
jgi:hypothetical protein